MQRTILAVFALALLFTAGCGKGNRGGGGGKPSPTAVDRGQNPNTLVRNAVSSRTALSSISGKGVMRIVDQPSKFGLTVNANLIADEQDRLRIRADKLAGAIQAFDVVMVGDDIGFYIPTQKTLYHGKVKDLRGFAFRFEPDDVLNQMLRPDTSLASRKWRYVDRGGNTKGKGGGNIVLEEDLPGGKPRLRVTINSRNGTLTSVAELDGSGEAKMVRRYDDYRSLSKGRGGKGGPDDEALFPYLISFNWPRDKRTMEMHFKQVQGNPRVSDGDFDLATSSDTKNRPLRDVQMDSD